jgi:hypothetical protein
MSLERGAETGDENKSGVKTDLVFLILGINKGKMARFLTCSQIGAPSLTGQASKHVQACHIISRVDTKAKKQKRRWTMRALDRG